MIATTGQLFIAMTLDHNYVIRMENLEQLFPLGHLSAKYFHMDGGWNTKIGYALKV